MTDNMPDILIYTCDEAPADLRIVGHFASIIGNGLQPIRFTGSNADDVKAEMCEWWRTQRAKNANIIARTEALRKAAKERAKRKASSGAGMEE